MDKKKKTTEQSNKAGWDRRTFLKAGLASVAAVSLPRLQLGHAQTHPLGFCPNSIACGENLRLFGPNFGATLGDLGVRVINGGNIAFTRPQSFVGGELQSKVLSYPMAMNTGQVETVLGEGYNDTPGNMPAELSLTEPIFSWVGGMTRYTSYQNLSLAGVQNFDSSCVSVWGGIDGTGDLYADLTVPYNADCCPICPVGTRMMARMYGATASYNFEFEFQCEFVITTALGIDQISDAICVLLQSAFQSNFGVTLDCNVSYLTGNSRKIAVSAPGGNAFTLGAMHLGINTTLCGCDSMTKDSVASESMNCDSMTPDCPSIDVDFVTFIFN